MTSIKVSTEMFNFLHDKKKELGHPSVNSLLEQSFFKGRFFMELSEEQKIKDLEERLASLVSAYNSLIVEKEKLQKIVDQIDLISWGFNDEAD